MSEVVTLRMQPIAAEVKEMERIGLYNPKELKVILNRQENLEYKINGASKRLQDFKDYITYLKALLRQINIRRDQLRIGEKKGAIEYKIAKRVQDLYEMGLNRFSDFSFCYSYFMFCKSRKSINVKTVESMIAKYFHNPDIFRIVSKWYLEDQNDVKNALKIINKGLAIHKNDLFLYKDAIEILLKTNDNPEKKIEKYVLHILQWVNDSKSLIEVLDSLQSHESTILAQNLIVDKLAKEYSKSAQVWHTLAEREYKGVQFGDATVSQSNFAMAVAKYKEGLQKVSSKALDTLKSFYLQFLITSLDKNDGETISYKSSLLKSTLQQFSTEAPLPEDRFYIIWAGLYNNEKAVEILEKGVSSHPNSINLWKAYFQYVKSSHNSQLLEEVFRRSLLVLESDAYLMWDIYIEHHKSTSSREKVEEVLKEALEKSAVREKLDWKKYDEWMSEGEK